jgi:hypothetical protein
LTIIKLQFLWGSKGQWLALSADFLLKRGNLMPTDYALRQNAQAIEADIRARRLLNLPVDWADEIIYPAYDGLSIRNIPHSIGQVLDAPFDDNMPLDSRVWGDESLNDIQRVVVFLSDGLGYLYLQELMEEDPELEDTVLELTDGRGFVPLTSSAPSTTAVALPTLWTGASPATHGMLGTSMFLREKSTLTNMLFNNAIMNPRGSVLSDDDLHDFVPVNGFAQHLTANNIATHLILNRAYLNKGLLSNVMHRGVSYGYSHGGHSDVWVRLADVLHDTAGQPGYINIYLGAVDSLSHLYGAKNIYVHYEIKEQLKHLLEVVSSQGVQDGQTLFIFTADHGHANAPRKIDLQSTESESIRRMMRLGLTGDMRLGQLHLQNGLVDDAIALIHANYGDSLTAISTAEALSTGLFGDDTIYSESKHRLGDVILIPRLGTQVVDSSLGVLNLESWHGGLSEDEMLVPFIYKRL